MEQELTSGHRIRESRDSGDTRPGVLSPLNRVLYVVTAGAGTAGTLPVGLQLRAFVDAPAGLGKGAPRRRRHLRTPVAISASSTDTVSQIERMSEPCGRLHPRVPAPRTSAKEASP